jgi:Cu-Zn family superoxide dismutase
MTRLTQISIWTWCAALAAAAVAVSAADVGAARQSAAAPAPPMTATAVLKDASGATIGAATLTDTPAGVLAKLAFAQGAPAGTHAVHLHAAGRCDPPDFTSAGGHFNPTKASHGFLDAEGPHAGDLPNVHAADDGSVRAELFSERIALVGEESADRGFVDRALGAIETAAGGSAANILGGGGVALVVHARPDDHRTGPSGDSGDRVACGVVKRN